MSQLTTLLEKVQERNLTKTDLEAYHTELTNLFAQILIEASELEKEEALYFLEAKEIYRTTHEGKDTSDIAVKRLWRGTEKGQRLITLKAYSKAIEKVLSSLRNRIYATL